MNMHKYRTLAIAVAAMALTAGPAAATRHFTAPVGGSGSFNFSLEPGADFHGYGYTGNTGASVNVTPNGGGSFTVDFTGFTPGANLYVLYSGKGNYRLNGGPPTPGIPEPAAWLAMITGFGAIGAMQRRRRLMVRSA